ncbi:hypothetical protein [Rhodococcus sp. T7]|uniref:hypothetical protein n=1 Tax=Rhodococcus sp. T7 TaxID=627444 RepID=UPI001F2E40D5|nr:hypothetical protein [Rhodococcus sp. T7]
MHRGDVALIDLRDGFPAGIIEQIDNQAVTLHTSMTALLLAAAVLLLVAALVVSRAAGWLGVIVGIGVRRTGCAVCGDREVDRNTSPRTRRLARQAGAVCRLAAA